MHLCIVKHGYIGVSETFIRTQAAHLPATVTVVEGRTPTEVEGVPTLARRGVEKFMRFAQGSNWDTTVGASYTRVLRRTRPDAVLAQYGTTAVRLLDACRDTGVPLVVHFHGYDASRHDLLRDLRADYERLFREAAGIVVVSRAMEQRLAALGADPARLHYSPCGVDCTRFAASDPAAAPPVFVAVGRFVEKKGPYLTLAAFAEAHRQHPEARLRMIGDGALLGVCRDLAGALGVADAVAFLGAQPHEVVQQEMSGARAFVQHSVEAADGDCEGTPVAVLEAGASALPVVATRHAGIPDVVVEGETGLLVDERDVAGMARHMLRLIENPALAARLGQAGRARVLEHYCLERNMERLWHAIQASVNAVPVAVA